MQQSIPVKIKLLDDGAYIPTKEFANSAGYDLRIPREVTIPAHSGSTIPLGFAVELPVGIGMFPFSRSGICIKGVKAWEDRLTFEQGYPPLRFDCKIRLGLVDADYRGECALLIDNDDEEFYLPAGSNVGQCVFLNVFDADFEQVDELSPSLRGNQGFNS